MRLSNALIDLIMIRVPSDNIIQVILGGGRKYFLPNDTADPEYEATKGGRLDGLNLIEVGFVVYFYSSLEVLTLGG